MKSREKSRQMEAILNWFAPYRPLFGLKTPTVEKASTAGLVFDRSYVG